MFRSSNPDGSDKSIDFGDGGMSIDLLAKGNQDFETFVEETFAALISRRESQIQGFKSDLATFARMDVSVVKTEAGDLQFFVNEVEMGNSTNLFFNGEVVRSQSISETISGALREKAVARRSGYAV